MADKDFDEAGEDSITPLIFGTITLLALLGLFASRKKKGRTPLIRTKYMPPDVVHGLTQQPNNGPVNPSPVAPPPAGSPAITALVQLTLVNPVQSGDSVLAAPTYSYTDSKGTYTGQSLPTHTYNYRFADFAVFSICGVASDWTNLTLTGSMTATYANDPPPAVCQINEIIFQVA